MTECGRERVEWVVLIFFVGSDSNGLDVGRIASVNGTWPCEHVGWAMIRVVVWGVCVTVLLVGRWCGVEGRADSSEDMCIKRRS